MKFRIVSLLKPIGLAAVLATLTACVAPGDHSSRSTGRYIDDKSIAARVKSALDYDPLYKFDTIHADVYRGVVQLNGFAITDSQKQRAGEIASHVPGILALENNISIAPEPPRGRVVREAGPDDRT